MSPRCLGSILEYNLELLPTKNHTLGGQALKEPCTSIYLLILLLNLPFKGITLVSRVHHVETLLILDSCSDTLELDDVVLRV